VDRPVEQGTRSWLAGRPTGRPAAGMTRQQRAQLEG
jgi:hypothetical protein